MTVQNAILEVDDTLELNVKIEDWPLDGVLCKLILAIIHVDKIEDNRIYLTVDTNE